MASSPYCTWCWAVLWAVVSGSRVTVWLVCVCWLHAYVELLKLKNTRTIYSWADSRIAFLISRATPFARVKSPQSDWHPMTLMTRTSSVVSANSHSIPSYDWTFFEPQTKTQDLNLFLFLKFVMCYGATVVKSIYISSLELKYFALDHRIASAPTQPYPFITVIVQSYPLTPVVLSHGWDSHINCSDLRGF